MARGIIRRKSTVEKVQPKLKVGEPGDKYEQEADAVADRVVSNAGPDPAVQMQPSEEDEAVSMKPEDEQLSMQSDEEKVAMSPEDEDQIAMKEEDEVAMKEEDEVAMKEDDEVAMKEEDKLSMKEEDEVAMKEEDEVAMKEDEIQKKPAIQKSGDGASYASPAVAQQIHQTKGQGRSMGESTQQELGSKMGADFSGVRIHTDDKAAALNESLGAKAFAHGNDIYFNKGNYDPGSSKGKHLLAHELTHTIQQKGIGRKLQKQETPPASTSTEAPGRTEQERKKAEERLSKDPTIDLSFYSEYEGLDGAEQELRHIAKGREKRNETVAFGIENIGDMQLYLEIISEQYNNAKNFVRTLHLLGHGRGGNNPAFGFGKYMYNLEYVRQMKTGILAPYMADGASVLMEGCAVAGGENGKAYLKEICRIVFGDKKTGYIKGNQCKVYALGDLTECEPITLKWPSDF